VNDRPEAGNNRLSVYRQVLCSAHGCLGPLVSFHGDTWSFLLPTVTQSLSHYRRTDGIACVFLHTVR
jgi:hypothetical protein